MPYQVDSFYYIVFYNLFEMEGSQNLSDSQFRSSRRDSIGPAKSHTFKGLLGCLGGLFIHLVISSLYQWGTINIYVTSYYKITHDP